LPDSFSCKSSPFESSNTSASTNSPPNSCSPAPALVLRHRHVLAQRNLQIVYRNLPILDAFFRQWPNLFEWVKPNASPIGFVRFKPDRDVFSFCEEVVRDSGVLLLPGAVYDQPRHIRFGYGRKNMPEALAHFGAFLDAHSSNVLKSNGRKK
jgi:aspartate/methionine/tyrosine aminotransferase